MNLFICPAAGLFFFYFVLLANSRAPPLANFLPGGEGREGGGNDWFYEMVTHWLLLSSLAELLRSRWNLCGGNLAFKQGACGHSGTAFFMSETERACSCLCHPLFSRQKIPKNPQPRSFYLTDSANIKPKCLSTSTAACQTSSIATRCPV